MSISIYAFVEEEGEWAEKLVLGGAEGEFQWGQGTFLIRAPYLPEPPGIAAGYTYNFRIDQNLDEAATECRCVAYGDGIFYFYIPSVEVPHSGGDGVDLKVEVPTTVKSSPSSFEPLTRRSSDGDLETEE